MQDETREAAEIQQGIVYALGEEPIFHAGDHVRILNRSPIGHYRVPAYLRGKTGAVEAVIEPAGIDNEEEGYGRNAGTKPLLPHRRSHDGNLAGLCRLTAGRTAHRGVRNLAGEDLNHESTCQAMITITAHDHAHAEIGQPVDPVITKSWRQPFASC